MNIRTRAKMIWANENFEIRIMMTEQEEYKEQYPGGDKYWYHIPYSTRYEVEIDAATLVFVNAMEAFQYAASLERR